MQTVLEEIKNLFQSYSSSPILSIEKLPQSGSDRIYFRIFTADESYIATFNKNIKENLTFLNFSTHFKKKNCPVPEIYAVNEKQEIYIQQDFGNVSLLNKLEEHRQNDYTFNLFKQSLKALAFLQINGDKNLDYNWCITSKKFGR